MKKECKHPPCGRASYSRGFCSAHYQRFKRGKDMDKPLRVSGNPVESFWQKVHKSDECWLWVGSKTVGGYGKLGIAGVSTLAHRFSYEIHCGPIPGGLHVDHLCWTRACVRPGHLRLVTNAENLQNMKGATPRSTSGVRGVYWIKEQKAWRAEVTLNGKANRLGCFSTVGEAEKVVVAWRRENMPFSEMDKKKETE